MGRQNREAMAHVGVRVEPTVRLGHEVEGSTDLHGLNFLCSALYVSICTGAYRYFEFCLQHYHVFVPELRISGIQSALQAIPICAASSSFPATRPE